MGEQSQITLDNFGPRRRDRLSDGELAAILAHHVLRWAVTADRFVIKGRRWRPRWRFQPAKMIADAFELLEAACIEKYVLSADRSGHYQVKVWAAAAAAEACGASLPRVICVAIARAHSIDVEGLE
jgi:hypothetical protein